MVDLDKLEKLAKEYTKLKKDKKESNLKNTAISLIDSIVSEDFSFPVNKEAMESNGTITFIYINNNTYPFLIEFIAEILHVKIPIIINQAKFGPGEIIITKENEKDAEQELDSCVKELQKLINGKKNKVFAI